MIEYRQVKRVSKKRKKTGVTTWKKKFNIFWKPIDKYSKKWYNIDKLNKQHTNTGYGI